MEKTVNDPVKAWYYERMLAELAGFGIKVKHELSKTNTLWGAYIHIEEASYGAFTQAYWQGLSIPKQDSTSKLDPKILIVAPHQRLSLQYHNRRAEHWRVVSGPVGIVTGTGQSDLVEKVYQTSDVVRLTVRQWHRLIGLDSWGLVAEIWESLDRANPSDEQDIIRVQDDFGR